MTYDDPHQLARSVAAAPRPLLVGLDVDGVLAPLVDHADDAVLLEGMDEAISAVAALDRVEVAAVSGRSLDGLRQFGFGPGIRVIGSHGMEPREGEMRPLDGDEQARLATLDSLAVDAAEQAGDGAWVERKPASVVLHVRQVEPERGRRALDELTARAEDVEGATVKAGNDVVELLARPANKGLALAALADDIGAATTVFAGDDVTDEDAFACLGDDDVSIKVGDDDTIARHRLADPPAVLAFLRSLA